MNKELNKPSLLKTTIALLIIMGIGYGIGFLTLFFIKKAEQNNIQSTSITQSAIVDGPENQVMPISNGRNRIKLPPVRINRYGINA